MTEICMGIVVWGWLINRIIPKDRGYPPPSREEYDFGKRQLVYVVIIFIVISFAGMGYVALSR